jgi:hypothetical protein
VDPRIDFTGVECEEARRVVGVGTKLILRKEEHLMLSKQKGYQGESDHVFVSFSFLLCKGDAVVVFAQHNVVRCHVTS